MFAHIRAAVLGLFIGSLISIPLIAFGGKAPAAPSQLSLKDPATLALRIDQLLDRYGKGVKSDPSLLNAYTLRIVPWFAENGISTDPRYATPRYILYRGEEANHILGYTYCAEDVYLNPRYALPSDPWYRAPDMFFTLAHELGHIQQGPLGCMVYSSPDLETSAQMMAFEVISSMANQGDKLALVSVLEELRDLALSQLRYQVLVNPKLKPKLDALYHRMFTPVELADRAQRLRYWSTRPDELKSLLQKYDVRPYYLLREMVANHLVLGPQSPDQIVFDYRSLRLDDFHYLLTHAEQMLSSASQGGNVGH